MRNESWNQLSTINFMNYRNLPKLENFEAYNPTRAEIRAASRRVYEPAEVLTGGQRKLVKVCCFIATAIMLETLYFKFTGAPESKYIFGKMGTEPWWRYGQGIWELLASICLLIPTLQWAGGILTTGALGAAILSHMTWLGYSVRGDHGLLFTMAVVTFICGATVLFLRRHSIPFVTPLRNW